LHVIEEVLGIRSSIDLKLMEMVFWGDMVYVEDVALKYIEA
jgi:hypothetical protein